MISKKQYEEYRAKTLKALADANIALTDAEKANVEVADFGLNRLEEVGLQVVTYVNTERCCAKELVLTPWQICPEHRHPPVNGVPGKEETFRCRQGVAYVYVGGFDDSVRGGSRAMGEAFYQYPLAVKLHLADLTATYLLERGTSNVPR